MVRFNFLLNFLYVEIAKTRNTSKWELTFFVKLFGPNFEMSMNIWHYLLRMMFVDSGFVKRDVKFGSKIVNNDIIAGADAKSSPS